MAEKTIPAVAILTIGEAKGHNLYIDRITLEQVLECARRKPNGVKFKEDHGGGVMDTVGRAHSFRIDGNVLRADLDIFESYKDGTLLMEMADTFPDEIGISINFTGQDEIIDGKAYARCDTLRSVDLVDSPAANPTGLFSERVDNQKEDIMDETKIAEMIGAAIAESVKPVIDQVSEMSVKLADYENKLAALQEPDEKEGEMEAKVKEMSEKDEALQAKVTELSEKLESLPKQFSEFLGLKPGETISLASVVRDQAPAKLFHEIVADMVAAGAKKTDAIAAAIKAHPKEYQFAISHDGLRNL